MRQHVGQGNCRQPPAVFEPGDDGRTILGRVAAKGPADELRDRGYLIIDGVDGKAHHVAFNARDELANYPTGAVVEVKGSADVTRNSSMYIDRIEASLPPTGAAILCQRLP